MQLKILNLNIWQGGNLFTEVVDFIKRQGPDILILQEVYNGVDPALPNKYRTYTELKEELGFSGSHFAPAFLDNRAEGKIESGNAIYSQFPILSGTSTFYDIPYNDSYVEVRENFPTTPRNLQSVVVDIGQGQLNVFNTQGIWGEDGGDSDRRLLMGESISQAVKDKGNVILAGDFNCNPGTKTIQKIEKHLTNVFGRELPSTFNMKHKAEGGYATAVVDMIFVSKEFTVVSKTCHDDDVSDHRALSVVVELK